MNLNKCISSAPIHQARLHFTSRTAILRKHITPKLPQSSFRSISSTASYKSSKMLPPPVVEMMARNAKQAETTYQAPAKLMQIVKNMRATKTGGVMVLSCSDPRLNPYKILGIDENLRAVMVRNAGGRAFDAIRSLAVLQTIGGVPGTIVVMHHTDCGMTHFHDDAIKKALSDNAPEEKDKIEKMQFGEILDIDASIREDVKMIKESPLIFKETNVIGLHYNIETGLLVEVE